MRAAASLLSSAVTLDGMVALLRAAGIAQGELHPAPETMQALGVEDVCSLIGGGRGGVRLLVTPLDTAQPLRTGIQQLVARLASRAPHVPWVVAVVDARGGNAAIVSWTSSSRSRRIVSFGWEPARFVDADAETLIALHGVAGDDDLLAHARYVEILGRDSLTRRFYRALRDQVGALATHAPQARQDDADALALLYVSRLLFLSFLEAKGWLNGERAFLATRYDECMRTTGGFHRRVLLPLFFGTLNTPPRRRAPTARAMGRVPFLNGGLFTRTSLERRARPWLFPDEQLGALFGELFQRFRFVAREDSATWSEASVDPEMLGRAFESLMSASDRKAGGVFFTPHELVSRVADEALAEGLRHRGASLREIRVLDPACGSGAFLVYVLERIAERRLHAGEAATIPDLRRDVLARSIFGVDRNPTAVWLCELRLWLSVVIEMQEPDPMRIPPLPNLDRNVRVGDALTGAAFDEATVVGGRRIASLRSRYVRAVGRSKVSLARALDREERRRALTDLEREIGALRHARREQVAAMRARNLFGERARGIPKAETMRVRTRLRAARAEWQRVAMGGSLPFSFPSMFAEAHAAGGFDAVLGNPPWVRLHRIPETLRNRFRESFEVYRGASWRSGADGARAGVGFASQVDLSALFVERALDLLREGGVMSFLLPVKLWQSLAGGGVRRLLMEKSQLLRVEDLSASRHAFDAAVYPSLLVARATAPGAADVTIARSDHAGFREWQARRASLPLDDSAGAPWLLLPPPVRAAFMRVRMAGIPLCDSRFGAPRMGVKSGCNSAFLVRVRETSGGVAFVENGDGERGKVEPSVLRPALRGDAVAPWRRLDSDERIVWTHDDRGPLARLPELTRTWLRRSHGSLAVRADAARARRWWSLFRVDAARCDRPRVVWADFGRRPRALVLAADDPTVPMNTCYVLRTSTETDAWALAAVLNSRLAAAWLNAIAESARGGYRRYLGWTVGQLPLPREWDSARHDLAAAGIRASGRTIDDDALLAVVLRAYGLRLREVRELLEACAG
ncbi:MAG TPA: N-6 DNA methylase [Gemmatimonadaceae bacterium]|nr:N-6 DNA methylase [Gemmatimonadaceae bacterium]